MASVISLTRSSVVHVQPTFAESANPQASMRKKGLDKIGEDKSPLVSDEEEVPEKKEKVINSLNDKLLN